MAAQPAAQKSRDARYPLPMAQLAFRCARRRSLAGERTALLTMPASTGAIAE
jgi:hypothetical protein